LRRPPEDYFRCPPHTRASFLLYRFQSPVLPEGNSLESRNNPPVLPREKLYEVSSVPFAVSDLLPHIRTAPGKIILSSLILSHSTFFYQCILPPGRLYPGMFTYLLPPKRSRTTSPASRRPATEGTKEILPGTGWVVLPFFSVTCAFRFTGTSLE